MSWHPRGGWVFSFCMFVWSKTSFILNLSHTRRGLEIFFRKFFQKILRLKFDSKSLCLSPCLFSYFFFIFLLRLFLCISLFICFYVCASLFVSFYVCVYLYRFLCSLFNLLLCFSFYFFLCLSFPLFLVIITLAVLIFLIFVEMSKMKCLRWNV